MSDRSTGLELTQLTLPTIRRKEMILDRWRCTTETALAAATGSYAVTSSQPTSASSSNCWLSSSPSTTKLVRNTTPLQCVSKNVSPLACYNFDINGFWYFWQKCYRQSKQSKRHFTISHQISYASALPGKTGKRENCIFPSNVHCLNSTSWLIHSIFLTRDSYAAEWFPKLQLRNWTRSGRPWAEFS